MRACPVPTLGRTAAYLIKILQAQNSVTRSLILGAMLISLAGGCAADYTIKQSADVILPKIHQFGTVVAFNTDSTILASGGQEGQIVLSGLPEGGTIGRVKAHRSSVSGIGFIGVKQFVSTGSDKRIILWDTSGIKLRETLTSSPITQMVISKAGRIMVTGHKDGVIRFWKLPGLELEGEYRLHRGTVLSVALDEAKQHFASSGKDGRVYVWSVGQPPIKLGQAPGKAASLLFSPDGNTLFGGAWFKLYRWDLASGALKIFPTEHHGLIYRLGNTGDNETLATISRHTDSAVFFLNAQTGTVVQRFQSHNACGADIAISPDGRYLATTSDDHSVRIWYLRKPS